MVKLLQFSDRRTARHLSRSSHLDFLRVLSEPTSRNTFILSCFFTINYQILTRIGQNDRCNLRTNLLFQTSAKSQNCTSRVSLLFLASESRCGASHSTYGISNVIKLAWMRSPFWCDTVTAVGDSTRMQALPLAVLTMYKETQGFHNFYVWLSYVSPISIGMGLHRRSSSIKRMKGGGMGGGGGGWCNGWCS